MMLSNKMPEDGVSLEVVQQASCMPCALSVPGMLLILDNAPRDMDFRHLQHCDSWYKDLKSVSS